MVRIPARVAALLVVALAACQAVAPPVVVTAARDLRERRLDNGLRVVLDPTSSATDVRVHVRYYGGSKDDPVGRAGLAHVVEHLTFERPPRPDLPALGVALDRLGGANGFTSLDSTDYVTTVPAPLLEATLWSEAARMAHPVDGLDDAAMQRAQTAVRNELRYHASAGPNWLAYDLLAEDLYGSSHPYGRVIGWRRGEADKLTLADAQAFTRAHYQPANAALVVSGRFDVDTVSKAIDRYFGGLPSAGAPARESFPIGRLTRDSKRTVSAPVRGRVLAVGWLAPPQETDGYDELALSRGVIEELARQRLVVQLRLAYDVHAYFYGGHLGSTFTVVITLREEAVVDRALGQLDMALSLVSTLGRTFEWDRFEDVRLGHVTKTVAGLEIMGVRAEAVHEDLQYVGSVRSVADEAQRLARIHPADVGGAVQQFLKDSKRAVIEITPDPNAPPGGSR